MDGNTLIVVLTFTLVCVYIYIYIYCVQRKIFSNLCLVFLETMIDFFPQNQHHLFFDASFSAKLHGNSCMQRKRLSYKRQNLQMHSADVLDSDRSQEENSQFFGLNH